MEAAYEYSDRFQMQIMACVCKDPALLLHYRDSVRAEYFETEQHRIICRATLSYWDQRGELPGMPALRQRVRDVCDDMRYPDELRGQVFRSLDRVESLPARDLAEVAERVVRFARRQHLRAAVLEISTLLLEDRGLEKASELVEDALAVGRGVADNGTDVFEGLETLPERRANMDRAVIKIPTGIRALDDAMNGGPAIGEVWSALAEPGGGKSAWLIHVAAIAARLGFGVAYATLGDLKEHDIELRAAASLTKHDQAAVIRGEASYREAAASLAQRGYFWKTKYWPSEAATVMDIRSWILRLNRTHNVPIRLLVLDYVGELKVDDDNRYLGLGRQMSNLHNLGTELGLLTWTGAQIVRAASKASREGPYVITQGDLAESFRQAFKLDGVMSLNQTADEYDVGRMRFWIDKSRRSPAKVLVPANVDFSSMTFTDRLGK